VPATQVAEWAGHSVEVLQWIYAHCLDGGTVSGSNGWMRRYAASLSPGSAPGLFSWG